MKTIIFLNLFFWIERQTKMCCLPENYLSEINEEK